MASNGEQSRNYVDPLNVVQKRDDGPQHKEAAVSSEVPTSWQVQENQATSPTNREGAEKPKLSRSYAQACQLNTPVNSERDPLRSTSSQHEGQEAVKTDQQCSSLQDHYTSDTPESAKKLDATRKLGNGYGHPEAKETKVCENTEQATGLNQEQNPATSNTDTNFTTKPFATTAFNQKPCSSVQQRKILWEQKSANYTDEHYKMLSHGHSAPGSDSEMARAGAGVEQLNEEDSSSEDEEETENQSSNNAAKPDNALAVVFNVLAPNAEKVYLELNFGGQMRTIKLKEVQQNRWKSRVWHFSPEEEVKYRYAMTSFQWFPWPTTKKVVETFQRSLSRSVNQYDVFWSPSDRNYFEVEFEGKLYYLNELYSSVQENSIKEFLLDCECMKFDHHTLTARQRQQFLKWLEECTQTPLNSYQALFLTVLLGRVASQRSFSSYARFPFGVADAILESIQKCRASVLPSNSAKYLEAAARVLIPESSSPGYLYLLAFFCWLIPTPNLLSLAKERCMNSFKILSSGQIDKLLSRLAETNPNEDSDLIIKFVISRIQNFSTLFYFYDSSYEMFQSTQERDNIFSDAFTKYVDGAISLDGANQPPLLQRWESLDQKLQQALSVVFTRGIVRKLDGNSGWWTKERILNLYEILQKEEVYSGKDMVPIVERLVASNKDELCNLFLRLLSSTYLTKWWRSLTSDKRKKLCISWLQSVIKKRENWRMSKTKVVELLRDLGKLCCTSQVDQDQSLKENLGEYILARLREMGLNHVLDAFHDVEHMSAIAKKYYVQSVVDVLGRKKDDVTRSVKDVIHTFRKEVYSGNRKSVELHVPRLAEDIVLSALEMTKPNITEDATTDSQEDVLKCVLEHRDLWLAFLGAKGHVTKLHKHPKLICIRKVLQSFAEAISTRCVRMGFIDDLVKLVGPSSSGEGGEQTLTSAFASLFCLASDSADDEEFAAWKNKTLEICKVKKFCEEKVSRVDFLVRFCQSVASEIGLPISNQQHWLNTITELRKSMSVLSLEEMKKDHNWLTVEKVFEPAESVFQLKTSHVFRIVAKLRLRREMEDEENILFVEDVANILNTNGIEEFQRVCNPLFDMNAEIPISQASLIWKEFRDRKSLNQEFSFIAEYFRRSHVNHKTEEMLFDYQKLPKLQQNVQSTIRLIHAFGHDLNCESQFLQTLHHFQQISNCQSSTLKDLSESMKSVADVDNLFEDESFKDVAGELANSRDLITFVEEVANEDIRVLIDAVEEHSDQSVSESIVSDLIELHRFLRGTLKNKSLSPKGLLESLQKSFEALGKTPGMAARIKSCSCNVHSLRGLYLNVANRGEVTKEIIANAVERGHYSVAVKKDQTPSVDMTYERQNGNEAAYGLADLLDLRSRALLILNADKKPTSNPDTKPVQFGTFVDQIDAVTEILRTLSKLLSSGNPKFRHFWKHLESIEEIKELERHLQEELAKWEEILKSARNTYFYLNYFYSDQLWKIHDYFASGNQKNSKEATRREVHSLLRYVDPTFKIEDMDDVSGSFTKSSSNKDLETNLCNLGAFLKEIFEPRRASSGVEDAKSIVVSAKQIKETVKPGQLYVAVLEPNSSFAVNVVMSLFQNVAGRLPNPNQILFCHQETEWDEVFLFLQRCFKAPNFVIQSELHCIANVENLSNEIQFDLVEEIKKLKEQSLLNNNSSFLLSLICCGGDHHHIVDQFFEFKHHVSGMTDVELKKCFAASFPTVSMITSDLPGSGKTESIRETAATNKRGVVTVPISGPVSREALLPLLCALKLRTFEILHLDIGEVDDAQFLDVFLFQLIVVGMVSSGTILYHLPTRNISIEISNTLHHWLRDSFPVCKCFNRVHLDQGINTKLKVSQEITSSVQVVCHYLDAYEKGLLERKDLSFSVSAQLEPLSEFRCRQLLSKHFSSTGDMTFTVLEIFLNVLADQLRKFSTSQYFRTGNLKVMLKGDHDVRTQLFRSLLEVSQEFASRSVLVCRSEQSEAVAEKQASEILERMRLQVGNTAEQMVDRVKGMIQWADSNHLMVVFNSLDSHTISALYRNVKEVPARVQDLFKSQALAKKLDDLAILSQKQLQEKLNRIVRSSPPPKKFNLDTLSYALTPDNVLKMALIIQRVRANIPVIVMGETGCGKTSLIRYLAKTCEVPFYVFNFHAGIKEEDIIAFISKHIDEAQKDSRARWVFLDEINTCDHLGLINDLICHRTLRGKQLPPNLVLMAACNPYRIRPSEQIETAGLSGKSTLDEYSKLVYRVHPLPETMIDYVWDYGSLHSSDEHAYIARMVETLFSNDHQKLLASLLSASQAFIRQTEKSPFCVSLRDVNRCKILIEWFYESLEKRPPLDSSKIEDHLKKYQLVTETFNNKYRSIILALAHCYQSRLPTTRTRKEYREKMAAIFEENREKTMTSLKANDFEAIVRMEQEEYLARMELPMGTAKNAALRENVFVMLVCILNHIPVFVVGKPGCSKSLSMQVIRSNLRGRDSTDDFFRNLPQLYVVSHQGSESSTSQGIIKVFDKARKYKEKNEEGAVLPVVLLDEIGLAEISKYNPLKVLHSLLEPEEGHFPDIAVVGISNWSLDAAKMNRAIHLSRPEPDIEDLRETGLSIRHANAYNQREASLTTFEHHSTPFSFPSDGQLECLAKAYYDYQATQKYANFHGLRDYYSLVKSLSTQKFGELDEFMSQETNSKLIQTSVQRNFGGIRHEENNIQRVFMDNMQNCIAMQEPVATPSLIAENLRDRLARHLMLITVADSAIGLLDQTLRKLDKETITIFGSAFEEDLSDEYNYRILSRIILCMERDCVLILRDLESIYGSLYDMLNQNYTVVGGKKNCRVALGAYSNPMCQVHDGFRCIVLVDQQKVDYADPPFLNRFEKQLLRFCDVITSEEKAVISSLQAWIEDFSTISHQNTQFCISDSFAGFHEDTLPSLVLHHRSKQSASKEELLETCKDDLLWVATPDGVLRSVKAKLADDTPSEVIRLCEEYFRKPIHDGIANYVMSELKENMNANDLKLFIMTHSNIHSDVSKLLEGVVKCQAEKLSSFKSEKHLTARLKTFWMDSEAEMLVLQCSPNLDAQHMLLMKSIIEQQRRDFLSSVREQDRKVKKHVCILIHMQRDNYEDLQPWQFNFLSGWKQVMIDVLEKPLLSLTEILGSSITDLLDSNEFSFRKIAIDQILWCFTCIKYTSSQRSLDGVLSLVKEIAFSEMVFPVLKELVKQRINQQDVDNEVFLMHVARPWQISVACDRQALINSSTLVGAMQRYVTHLVRQPLAMIVFFLEKESAWPRSVTDCDTEDQHELNEWSNLLLNKEIFNINEIATPRGAEFYEVQGERLHLRFPFSTVIKRKIEEVKMFFMEDLQQLRLEEDNMDDEGELKVDVTIQQLERFSFIVKQKAPQLFESKWALQNIVAYLEDILDITSAEVVPELSRIQRLQLLKSECACNMVHSLERDAPLLVTEIHSILWKNTTLLAAELELFKAGHSVTVELDALFQKYTKQFHEMTVFQETIDELDVFDDTNKEPPQLQQFNEFETSKMSNDYPKKEEHQAFMNETGRESKELRFERDEKNGEADEDLEQIVLKFPSDLLAEEISPDNNDDRRRTPLNQVNKPDGYSEESTDGEGRTHTDTEVIDSNSKPQKSFAEDFVEASIKALLPTQPTVERLGGPALWLRSANMILSLATRLLVHSPVVHYLRICYDFASLVLLPENLEPYSLYYLGLLGEGLSPSFLDSPESFEKVDNFLSDLEVCRPERIQHFCSLFYGRCIETNPDTELLYSICERICSDEKSAGLRYMGSVIHRVFLNEEAFSPGIFIAIIESSENLNDEHPALIDIDSCLSNDENKDSHFAVLCCDLLCEVAFQNVDVSNISGSEDETMKQFHMAVQVLFDNANKCRLIMVCAIAFLRSFLKSLAVTLLQNQCSSKHSRLLHEVNAQLKSQTESTPEVNTCKLYARLYLLKEFRRLLSLYDLRCLLEKFQQLTCFVGLKWTDSVSLYKSQQNCLCNTSELSDGQHAMVLLMENKETEAIENFVSSAVHSFDNKIKLVALITESFYHVQSIRPIKDTELQAAKKISELVDLRFSRPFSELVKHLTGEKDFQSPELQMETLKSSIEVQRATLILHLAALVFSNLKQSGNSSHLGEPFSVYMLNPIMACDTYFIAGPTSSSGYDVYLNINKSLNPLYVCSCGTAFVCTANTENPRCPNCKSFLVTVVGNKSNVTSAAAVKGYLPVDPGQLKSNTTTTRSLKPAVFRTLHLLVHAALYAGATFGQVDDKTLSTFLTGNDNLKEPHQYCYSHFQNDLAVLSQILACSEERVVTWIHKVLHKTSDLFTATSAKESCKTEAQRGTLEMNFSKKIESLIPDIFQGLPSHQHVSSDQARVEGIEIQIDEDDEIPTAQNDETQSESLRRLFRITIPKSYEQFRAFYLNADDVIKTQYPVIGLFLDHSSDLSTLCHLNSLLRWPRKVESLLSRRLSRQQAKSKLISEFVRGDDKGKDSAENLKLFDAFKRSWDEVRKHIADYLGIEETKVPRLSEMSCIGYCLIEEQESGAFLVAALKALQNKQNTFLEKVLQIAASGKCSTLNSLQRGNGESVIQVVHLQDAKEKELIQYEWTDEILRHCQNNTEYGRGREIIYDLDKIEKELVARFLLGKSYLLTGDGLRKFVFSQELFHSCAGILSDIQQSIPQVPVTAQVRNAIFRLKEKSLKNVQDLLEHLEVVVCLLKQTKGDPDELLTKYTDKWLSMLPCPFPKHLIEECCDAIMLEHIVALYQSLEDILSEAAVDSIPDAYRVELIDETKKDLDKLSEVPHKMGETSPVDALKTALRRFTYRYLSAEDFLPSPASHLSPCLNDPSLWPLGFENPNDIVPRTLLIGNVRPALDYLQKLSENLQRKPQSSRPAATRRGAARTARKKGSMFGFT